jgi:hypothetical protein
MGYSHTMTNRRAATAPAQPPAAVEPAADELERLSQQVGALRLCWSDPWAFYEARSDLAARLRRLARWAREAEATQREAGN